MIRRLLIASLGLTLTIGTILIALHLSDLGGMTVIESHTINYFAKYTWTYYTFSLKDYLKNLETSIKIEQITKAFPNIPTLPNKPNDADVVGWLKFIANIITVYVINWLIFIVNMTLILPIKVLLYPVNIMFAIFGLQTSSNDAIEAFNLLYSLNIPLIKNF